jgi:hypothetical protein
MSRWDNIKVYIGFFLPQSSGQAQAIALKIKNILPYHIAGHEILVKLTGQWRSRTNNARDQVSALVQLQSRMFLKRYCVRCT